MFAYAGTLSLSKELVAVPVEDMEIGDVFIQRWKPRSLRNNCGYCRKSDVKSEDIHACAKLYACPRYTHTKNPKQQELSPWYPLDFGDELFTPEWTFKETI